MYLALRVLGTGQAYLILAGTGYYYLVLEGTGQALTALAATILEHAVEHHLGAHQPQEEPLRVGHLRPETACS